MLWCRSSATACRRSPSPDSRNTGCNDAVRLEHVKLVASLKTNMQDIGLFLVGIAVGGMNAIAGGGILIGFPLLLAAGLPALAANATCNIVVLPGALSSAY